MVAAFFRRDITGTTTWSAEWSLTASAPSAPTAQPVRYTEKCDSKAIFSERLEWFMGHQLKQSSITFNPITWATALPRIIIVHGTRWLAKDLTDLTVGWLSCSFLTKLRWLNECSAPCKLLASIPCAGIRICQREATIDYSSRWL